MSLSEVCVIITCALICVNSLNIPVALEVKISSTIYYSMCVFVCAEWSMCVLYYLRKLYVNVPSGGQFAVKYIHVNYVVYMYGPFSHPCSLTYLLLACIWISRVHILRQKLPYSVYHFTITT